MVGHCNTAGDRFDPQDEQQVDSLVSRPLVRDNHKLAGVVCHIAVGQVETLKLPAEPRNPYVL